MYFESQVSQSTLYIVRGFWVHLDRLIEQAFQFYEGFHEVLWPTDDVSNRTCGCRLENIAKIEKLLYFSLLSTILLTLGKSLHVTTGIHWYQFKTNQREWISSGIVMFLLSVFLFQILLHTKPMQVHFLSLLYWISKVQYIWHLMCGWTQMMF